MWRCEPDSAKLECVFSSVDLRSGRLAFGVQGVANGPDLHKLEWIFDLVDLSCGRLALGGACTIELLAGVVRTLCEWL